MKASDFLLELEKEMERDREWLGPVNEYRKELKSLLELAPDSLDQVPQEKRASAQQMIGQAFYRTHQLERARHWLNPPLTLGSALWLGYTCFDQKDYLAAFPQFCRAYHSASLQDWAALKVFELILCCQIYLGEDGLWCDEVDVLASMWEEMEGEFRPLMLELNSALNARFSTLHPEVLREIDRRFPEEAFKMSGVWRPKE